MSIKIFIVKFKVLFMIAIVLSPIQCEDFPDCPKGEKKSETCWPRMIVSCKERVKTDIWSCRSDCVCEHKWHVRDDENKCIPVWKCPRICPSNSHFHSCVNDNYKPLFVEQGFTAAEFRKLCKVRCECEKGFEPNFTTKTCHPRIFKNKSRRRIMIRGQLLIWE